MTPVSVVLVGTGSMASEYGRVLRAQPGCDLFVLARDPGKAETFAAHHGASGSLPWDGLTADHLPPGAGVIVAVAVEALSAVVEKVLGAGARHVLVEKPGALSAAESRRLADMAAATGACVRVAYNRRYYRSVQFLRATLAEEPPLCASFDFTEWVWRVESLPIPLEVKQRWALANSIHVLDTVTFLLGPLREITAQQGGAGAIAWHSGASVFAGTALAGSVPVSWATSWLSPGRWGIEVMTAEGRYRLSPMERLEVLRHRDHSWNPLPSDSPSEELKPGLSDMLYAWLSSIQGATDSEADMLLPDLAANAALLSSASEIAGYAAS